MTNFGIKDIVKMFGALLIPTISLKTMPPLLILAGAQYRTGLSPRNIANRIKSRIGDSSVGGYIADLPDGSENVMNKVYEIIAEEIVSALQTEAKIDVTIKAGQQVDGTFVGWGSGKINGVTTTVGTGNAIIR